MIKGRCSRGEVLRDFGGPWRVLGGVCFGLFVRARG